MVFFFIVVFSFVSSIIIIIIIHLLLVHSALHMSFHTNCVCIRSKRKKTKLIGRSADGVRERADTLFHLSTWRATLKMFHPSLSSPSNYWEPTKKIHNFDIISVEINKIEKHETIYHFCQWRTPIRFNRSRKWVA